METACSEVVVVMGSVAFLKVSDKDFIHCGKAGKAENCWTCSWDKGMNCSGDGGGGCVEEKLGTEGCESFKRSISILRLSSSKEFGIKAHRSPVLSGWNW